MKKIDAKVFTSKIFAGLALGIVGGLIPNAILGELFKALTPYASVFGTLHQVLVAIQFTVPAIIGVLIALQFDFTPVQIISTAAATFVGSGVAQFDGEQWLLKGMGDLVNTGLVAVISVLIIIYFESFLSKMAIILTPILGGALPGYIGLLMLPYVMGLTGFIGQIIANFTHLQLLLMSILISISFALIIVSPMSTVAVGLAIQLNGLGSGAGNLGIVAAAVSVMVGSYFVNPGSITTTVFFAGPKMFMPNFIKRPILLLPVVLSAICTGIGAYLFNIQGTPESAGFGFTGLVGPIKAYALLDGSSLSKIIAIIITFVVIPVVAAYLFHVLFTKVFKLYDSSAYIYQEQ